MGCCWFNVDFPVQYVSGGDGAASRNEITFSQFLAEVEAGSVTRVTMNGDKVTGTTVNGQQFTTYVPPNDPNLVSRLTDRGVSISVKPVDTGPSLLGVLISWFPMLLLVGVWVFFMRQMQGGGRGAMGFGKSKAKLLNEASGRVTFDDVAGIDEAKDDLTEIVDFFERPKPFSAFGRAYPERRVACWPSWHR